MLVPCLAAAAGFLAFGAKLMLIRTHGSDVPFYDEWDAVGRTLLVPMAQGDLHAANFFVPQNEHRIVLVRVMAYLATLANGQWDPLVEMTLGAVIHSVFCAALVLLARRFLSGIPFAGACILIVLMFAFPFDWENTLQALQAQHYLLLGCALGTLWLCLSAPPLGIRWWMGFAFAVLGLGTMASGFAAAAVVIAFTLATAAYHKGITRRELASCLLMAVLCLVGLFSAGSTPPGPASAHSAGGAWVSMATALSWPDIGAPAMCLVMQLPIVLLASRRIRERNLPTMEGVLFAVTAWSWMQMAAIATARAQATSPRYMDLFALESITNVIALGILCAGRPVKRVFIPVGILWVSSFICGFRALDETTHAVYLDRIPAIKAAEKFHVRAFLASGNEAALRSAPPNELPYPVAGTLAGILGAPGIRAMLPMGIREPLALSEDASSNGFARAKNAELPSVYPDAGWIAARGPAHFVSQPLAIDLLPYLHFQVSGSPDLSTSAIRLESDAGVATDPSPRALGKEWRSFDLGIPPNATARLVVDVPAGDHWLAFVNPIEAGALSVHNRWLLRRGSLVSIVSAFLFVGFLVLAVSGDARKIRTAPGQDEGGFNGSSEPL